MLYPPLLLIAPPCSGKTTFMENRANRVMSVDLKYDSFIWDKRLIIVSDNMSVMSEFEDGTFSTVIVFTMDPTTLRSRLLKFRDVVITEIEAIQTSLSYHSYNRQKMFTISLGTDDYVSSYCDLIKQIVRSY